MYFTCIHTYESSIVIPSNFKRNLRERADINLVKSLNCLTTVRIFLRSRYDVGASTSHFSFPHQSFSSPLPLPPLLTGRATSETLPNCQLEQYTYTLPNRSFIVYFYFCILKRSRETFIFSCFI